MEDYYNRIRDHERHYETIDEADREWPYIKIFNVGEKIVLNKIQGYLQSRIIFFLMNIHNRFRTIYFARVSRISDGVKRRVMYSRSLGSH